MPCSICNHPKRQEIDQALVAGSSTLAALGQEYDLSTSALHRHKAHLQAKISRAQDQLQDNLRQGYIFWLSQSLEMAMQTAQAAQAEGNSRLVLQALAQGTRLINIILKQDLQLDDRVIYEILASPQWATQASLLPDDPQRPGRQPTDPGRHPRRLPVRKPRPTLRPLHLPGGPGPSFRRILHDPGPTRRRPNQKPQTQNRLIANLNEAGKRWEIRREITSALTRNYMRNINEIVRRRK